MLSPFGVFLRNLRMVRNETLKEMANKLGATDSYLSAVELNKRNIPKRWLVEIGYIYNLNEAQCKRLNIAFDLTAMSNLYDKLNLTKSHKQALMLTYIELKNN